MRARLLLVAASSAIAIGAADVVLGVAGQFPRAGKTPDTVLWRPDRSIGFAPATDLDVEFFTNEWITRVRTDRFGFRVRAKTPHETRPHPATVLFLGDSQTMGIQVAAESTFVELIGAELAKREPRWQAINAGCNGFNTTQAYFFFEQLFERGVRPGVVVLYATNNDLFPDVAGLPYARYQVGDDGFLQAQPPDPEALDRLTRAKAAPAPPSNFWLQHSALLRHVRYTYRLMRREHDVATWVTNSYLRDEADPASSSRWAAAAAALRSLRRRVESYGGRLVIAVHPDPVEWSQAYFTELAGAVPELASQVDRMKIQHGYRRLAQREGIAFVDMLDGFPPVTVREFRFRLDPHASESGHRVIAAQLLKGLDRLGAFDRAPALKVSP